MNKIIVTKEDLIGVLKLTGCLLIVSIGLAAFAYSLKTLFEEFSPYQLSKTTRECEKYGDKIEVQEIYDHTGKKIEEHVLTVDNICFFKIVKL